MPVVRKCIYCSKNLLTSTYGMIKHVSTCKEVPKNIRDILNNKPDIIKIINLTNKNNINNK